MHNKSHSEKITAIVTCRKTPHDLAYMCLEGQKQEHNKKEGRKERRRAETFPYLFKKQTATIRR